MWNFENIKYIFCETENKIFVGRDLSTLGSVRLDPGPQNKGPGWAGPDWGRALLANKYNKALKPT